MRLRWFVVTCIIATIVAVIGDKVGLYEAPIQVILGVAMVVGAFGGLIVGLTKRYMQKHARQ